jgi:hypothetical protein
MTCDCMKQVNEKLASHNGRLATGFQITAAMGIKMRLLLATEKLDKKKRNPVPTVTATYCPFCGTKAEAAA